MAFVRKRGESHQIIETYREGGKVRQRVLINLGPYPSVAEALEGLRARVADRERRLAFCERQAKASYNARRQWNYSIKVAATELMRARAMLADIERRSVKTFVVKSKKSDTTAKPSPSAVDRLITDAVERLGR